MIRSTFSLAIRPASLVAWRCASLKYAGTVITASVTVSPRYASASFLSLRRIIDEISCGVYCFPSIFARKLVPISLFIEKKVRSTLTAAWRLAVSPTSRSPSFENATTDGVVRDPSAFVITTGWSFSNTATQLFVVPRSIPITLPMECPPLSLDSI